MSGDPRNPYASPATGNETDAQDQDDHGVVWRRIRIVSIFMIFGSAVLGITGTTASMMSSYRSANDPGSTAATLANNLSVSLMFIVAVVPLFMAGLLMFVVASSKLRRS